MLGASLIKADDNLVALWQAPHPLVKKPEIFIRVPPPKPPSSTTIVALTTEGPLQIETDMDRGPTTTTTAPEVS